MKKLSFLVFGIFLCGLFFTSFSPSLDGRAVVADDGVMPQGLFAKTVGYLPGDSISVSNLSKNSTVDILVIGALDASEGVAILLTPEAAEALGMQKGANNVVKITKRTGQLDEAVNGTAVIGGLIENDYVEEEFENEVVEGEPESLEENQDEEKTFVEEIENIENKEESIVEDNQKDEEVLISTEEKLENESENEEIVLEPEAETENDKVVEDSEIEIEKEKNVESEKIVDEENENDMSEKAEVEIDDEIPLSEKTLTEEVVVENIVDEKNDPVYEKIEDELLQQPKKDVKSERYSENIPDDNEEMKSEKVEPDSLEEKTVPVKSESVNADDMKSRNDDIVASEPYQEEITNEVYPKYAELEKTEEESLAEESKDATVETVKEDDMPTLEAKSEILENSRGIERSVNELKNTDVHEDAGEESYEPIVLVPVESNPPVKSEITVPENKSSKAEKSVESSKSSGHKKDSFAKYRVKSLKDLERGKYYIQIGVYSDDENIKSIIEKYGESYPIVLVPLASGKAQQVMIGPLTVDEYGTVQNRFKSYGYKDCFLRKIR